MTHRALAAAGAAVLIIALSANGQATVAAPARRANGATANQTLVNAQAMAVKPVPANLAAIHAKISPRLSPAARTWAQSEGRVIAGRSLSAHDMTTLAQQNAANRFAGQGLTSVDIEALAFCALMEASADAQDDLKAIMAGVKAINNAKAQQRALLSAAQHLHEPQADSLPHEKHQSSDLTQEQQVQMQAVMDRMTQADEAMSSIAKQVSGTQSQIIPNLK